MITASRFGLLAATLVEALVGCSESADKFSEAGLRGQRTYQNVCVACHHPDPNLAGILGPPLAGASLELLEAKVLNASYPPGYTPKRPTASMPAFAYLGEKLPDLDAYLREVQSEDGTAGK